MKTFSNQKGADTLKLKANYFECIFQGHKATTWIP